MLQRVLVTVDLQLEESLQCAFFQAVTVCCLHQLQLTEDPLDTSSANGECHSVYSCEQRVVSYKTKAFRLRQGVVAWQSTLTDGGVCVSRGRFYLCILCIYV